MKVPWPLLLLLFRSGTVTTTSAFAVLDNRSTATTRNGCSTRVAAGAPATKENVRATNDRRRAMTTSAGVPHLSRRPSSSPLLDDTSSRSSSPATRKGSLCLHDSVQSEMEPSASNSKASSPLILLVVAASLLTLCIGGVYTGILPGYTTGEGVVDPTLILHDVGMTLLAAVLGYAFVKINTLAVKAGLLDPRDARKVIHTGAAPLFVLFWPGFETRFFAAIIPILNAFRLFLAAEDSNSELAAAVSRSGDIKEARGGPFIYVIMIITCLLLFWTSSPVGVVALCTLAAGDGLADLVGRRWGRSNPWPGLASGKSVAGSLAFWSASTVVSYGILSWLQYTNCLVLTVDQVLLRLAAVTLVAALVELIPQWDDNYTVPIAAAAMSAVLLQ